MLKYILSFIKNFLILNQHLNNKNKFLNGKRHGPWESYWFNGNLHYKGEYLNDQRHGYWESYWDNGQLWYKGHYLNGERIGYWIQNDKTLFYA
jgi:antitoxin component YwqK of YwqJK toxin-antitoxin module